MNADNPFAVFYKIQQCFALIRIVKEIRRRKMKTKIIGTIHDSIVADVPKKEIDEYAEIVVDVSTVRLREEWRWLNVPLAYRSPVLAFSGADWQFTGLPDILWTQNYAVNSHL